MLRLWNSILLFMLVIGLGACKKTEAPPQGPTSAPTPTIDTLPSEVNIPVQIHLDKLTELALSEVKNPISSGTDEVDANVKLKLLTVVEKEVEKVERSVRNEVRKVRKKTGQKCKKIIGSFLSKLICEPVFSLVEVTVQIPQEVIKVVKVLEEVWVDEVRNTKVRVKHEASISSFSIALQGRTISLAADIDYWLELGVKEEYLNSIRATVDGIATCGVGEELRRVRVEVYGNIDADEYGNLTFTRDNKKITWVRECRLTAADIEVSDILDLPGIDKAFDKAINKAIDRLPSEYQLRPVIAKTWQQMQESLKLAENIYISVNPEQVGLTPITGAEGVLHTGASVKFRPIVSYGKKPASGKLPLPEKFGQVGEQGAFNLLVNGVIHLETLSNTLYDELKSESIEVSGKKIIFDKPRMYGGKNRELVLGVKVKKPIKATLYLTGTPTLDLDKKTIAFPDLAYTLDTKNWLAKSADFFLHDKFLSMIREKTVFDLDENTRKVLATIGSFDEPVGPGVLQGKTESVGVEYVGLSRYSIHTYLSAKGTASYRVTEI